MRAFQKLSKRVKLPSWHNAVRHEAQLEQQSQTNAFRREFASEQYQASISELSFRNIELVTVEVIKCPQELSKND